MKKTFTYQILIPGGNDTALVFGLEEDRHFRHRINDLIMERHPNVEQVGFVGLDDKFPQLMMAGGEFCGNATRSAAWHYLSGQPGEISIQISGVRKLLQAGVTKDGQAWAQMPVAHNLEAITPLGEGKFLIQMDGISHVAIKPESATQFLTDGNKFQTHAFDILDEFDLLKEAASGVLFLEQTLDASLKMHPCVYVSAIDKMYYETACGSGTVAVALLEVYEHKATMEAAVLQPSGEITKALVEYNDGSITNAVIKGPIKAPGKIYQGVI